VIEDELGRPVEVPAGAEAYGEITAAWQEQKATKEVMVFC
jgi:hypothetical protein